MSRLALVPSWLDIEALRYCRRSALMRAWQYRNSYRQHHDGFDHRMWAEMLQQAREYRAAEKDRQQHQQEGIAA